MRNFDREWDRMERRGNWFFRFVFGFIGLAFIGTIAFYVLVIGAVVKHGGEIPEIIGETAAKIEKGYEAEKEKP